MEYSSQLFYGFATTIQERINILKNKFPKDKNLTALKKWRSRKTLLSDSDFSNMLKKLKFTELEYDIGVAELTEEKLVHLFSYVKKQKWYLMHKLIFTHEIPNISSDFDAAIRFHLHYYECAIKKYFISYPIQLSNQAIDSFIEALKKDLLMIAKPTLVWDVHDIKERFQISASTDEKEFAEYLKRRFATSESTEQFFLEYPVLARILAMRLIYAIDNFKKFIDSVAESFPDLHEIFNIDNPCIITSVEANIGDSHNLGQAGIIFSLNDKKLVYKYHNNDIRVFFNDFLKYISHFSSGFTAFNLKLIAADDYCIEEFISYESCTDLSQIKEYYRKYGMLVALTHWLGSTDLHMENLIAHEDTPILVDIETLLFAEERRTYSHKISKNKIIESNSAIISGLLPMQKYWKRELDYSALNGIRQKIPFKVRRLLNEKSSNIMYKLQDDYFEPAQNVPLLNDVPITFDEYKNEIINGYITSINILMAHKNDIILFLMNHLKDQQVRVLLRDTQDYFNFLNFSIHPTCMSNFIEHEKVLENLWNHSFICNDIVPLEINALMFCDIPYFYTKVKSYDLYSNDKMVSGFFIHSIKELLNSRLNRLNKEQIRLSLLLVKESINSLKYTLGKINIPRVNEYSSTFLSLASDIKEVILNQIIVDKRYNSIVWPEVITMDDKKTPILYFPDSNFYNGTSGIYVFLYALSFYTKEKIPYLDLMEKEVFDSEVTTDYYSAFYGYGAQILSAFILYRLTKKRKFYNYMQKSIGFLINCEVSSKSEWLGGSSSLLCLLVEIFRFTSLPEAKQLINKIFKLYTIQDLKDSSFAHGYAGVLFGLIRIRSVLNDSKINILIEEVYNLLISNLNGELNSSWCKGTLGINKALEAYAHINMSRHMISFTPDITLQTSCICHGEFGNISFLLNDYLTGNISEECYKEKVFDLLNRSLYLYSVKEVIPLGLFTGISGIGYQLLRLYDSTLFDILFFL